MLSSIHPQVTAIRSEFLAIPLTLWYYVRTEVVISPPSIYLIPLKDIIRKDIQLAAQNCYFKSSGAFTGEIR